MTEPVSHTAVFIDWENINDKNIQVDPNKLTELVHSFGDLRHLFVYMVDHEWVGQSGYRRWQVSPIARILEHRGFVVREKVPWWHNDPLRKKIKKDGNLDVDIAIDVMDILHKDSKLGHLVLFSGDGDFLPLLRRVQNHRLEDRILTTVVAWEAKTSAELARMSNHYIKYETIVPKIRVG